ncbi:MAG: glycosyltransferase family 4 protein [Patescibacteria group bacterium]
MKILLANKFYYLKGGAERYFFDLKNLLEEKGNKVITFSMQDKRNVETPYKKYFVSQIDIEKPKFSFKSASRIIYSFEAKKKMEELIKKEKPDIAHLHNIYHQISPSILTVLKKHKIPIVMTLHDFKILCPVYILYSRGEICEKCKTYRYWHCVQRRCAKNSLLASKLNAFEMFFHKFLGIYEKNIDLFITPSEFLKNKILEWRRLAENKIKVLPHFAGDGSLTTATSVTNFASAQFVTPSNYILYFGRLSHEKGVDILLEAIKILKNSGKLRIKLYLAGFGPKEKELKDFVGQNNLQDDIKFLGYLKGDALSQTIKNSLFVVMPSRVYESFGLAALEANMLGKSVIASNLGALPELIIDGQTGMLFKVGSAKDLAERIILMLDDQKKLEEMGNRGRKLILEKYNKEIHWQKLEDVYKKLLNIKSTAKKYFKSKI